MNKESTLITKNTSNVLKGIFMVMVLLSHLFTTGIPFINAIILAMGKCAVAGFFFLSGYGIMLSYKQHGKDYLKKLALKRIPYIYLIVIITNIVYLILYGIMTNFDFTIWQALTSIFYISSYSQFINVYSWIYFMVDLLYYYIIFLAIACILELLKAKKKFLLSAIIFLCVVITVFSLYWVIADKQLELKAIFCFPLGLFSAYFLDKLKIFISKNKVTLIVLGFLLTSCSILFANLYDINLNQILAISFIIFILPIFANITIKNVFLTWLGNVSLYAYLSHGFFYKIFVKYVYLNGYLEFFIEVALTFIVSYALYTVIKAIKTKKQSNNNCTQKE